MSQQHVKVPIRTVNGAQWGDLSVFGKDHEICGTRVDHQRDISFLNQHRVRVVRFKQMVYWKIPQGTELDITDVGNPRRRRS
jgi:hypothetical protein